MPLLVKRGFYFLIIIWLVLCISSCGENLSDGGKYMLPPGSSPLAPSNLLAVPQGRFYIDLSWSDESDNESGFKIERKKASDSSPYAEVGTAGADVNSYTDSGLISNIAYSYRVRAYNSAADSDYSNEVSVTTLPFTVLFGTSTSDGATGVDTDSEGNIYVTGNTQSDLDGLGSEVYFGGYDFFLIKYNPFGEMQWLRQIGTTGFDVAYAIAVDKRNSNIYVTGYTETDLDTLDGYDSWGGDDFFIVKYDNNGNKIWSMQWGTDANDYGYGGITIDNSGNLFIAGITGGSFPSFTNQGAYDIFVAKLNSLNGSPIWIKQHGTSSGDFADSIAVDSLGYVYVTGRTEGNLDGNQNSGEADIFLIKYNSAGVHIYTKLSGTAGYEEGEAVAVDVNDNVYITGYTQGNLDGNSNQGGRDIFLMKYDSAIDSEKIWTKLIGTGAYGDVGHGVSFDSDGSVYVTGETAGDLDGSGEGIFMGASDIFLVKFYPEYGDLSWVKQIGTVSADIANCITLSNNNIFISGETSGNLDGNINSGGKDVFLLKYDTSGEKR